jgi:hypothetical protein
MTARITRGIVVFRRWDEGKGLSEVSQAFQSVDELFTLCLQTGTALLVDRIVIEGVDEHDTLRTLTLVFQSVSVRDGTGAP